MCNAMDYLAPNDRSGKDLTGPDQRMMKARNHQREVRDHMMDSPGGNGATMQDDWREMGSFVKRAYRGGFTFTKNDVRTK